MKNNVYNICLMIICIALAFVAAHYSSVWAGIGSAIALLALERDK